MTQPSCAQVREALRALQAGRVSPDERAELERHLASCDACRAVDAEERALSELLHTKLPRPQAPADLHARLASLVAAESGAPVAVRRGASVPTTSPAPPDSVAIPVRSARAGRVVSALAVFAAAAAALLVVLRPAPSEPAPLLREVVNDHLRVLYAQQPIEIESGGIHQVKPWFEGRVDFAPRVSVDGDEEFPLVGGAVGYVVDRKAATFVFKRRLHTITLFVFPSAGLPWPELESAQLGVRPAGVASVRGFNVVMFQRDDLGYALVSDLNARELGMLATKLATQ